MNEEIKIKLERFKNQMLKELKNNQHKGLITEFTDFDKIMTELEYHKAKMIIAIRYDNKQAIKEYIADTANFLFALGNIGGLYDDDFIDLNDNESIELNKDIEMFKITSSPSVNQSINLHK